MKIRTHAVSIIDIVIVNVTRRIDVELVSVVIIEIIGRERPPNHGAALTRDNFNGIILS